MIAPPGARRRRWLLLGLTAAFLAAATHDAVFLAGNDASRFAQIEALADLGEPWIDGSRYAWTPDRVTLGGHQYSNKPPALALAGAVVYEVLSAGGLGFARAEAATVYLLTLSVVGVTMLLLVAAFAAELDRRYPGLPAGAWWGSALALALGTPLASFATTFNNHTVAAALLFAACAAAWRGRGAAAGAGVGLAAAIDLVPGLVFAPALAWTLRRTATRRAQLRFVAGLAVAAALFVLGNLAIAGRPLPPKMVAGAIDRSTAFAPSLWGVLTPDRWTYPLAALFGWHGFFSLSPVLLLAAWGMARAARTGRPLPRVAVGSVAAAAAVVVAGHALLVGSYGGWSYGFRYLLPLVPVLLLFLPVAWERLPPAAAWSLLAVSIATALLGAYHPWPPAYEQRARPHPIAARVENPVGANAAALLRQHAPGWPPGERLAAAVISRDPLERDRYLYLFYRSKGDLTMARRVRAEATARGGLVE